MLAQVTALLVCDLKPFYWVQKSYKFELLVLKKIVELITTINDSMDGKALEVFIENFLVPKLWVGAVVVRDNIPSDKMAAIAPMIEAFGANIINLSRYYLDFNPIELW